MSHVLRIIKVNGLALLALPLLLLSIAAKLVSKALEKALVIVGVLVVLLGLSLLSLVLKNPSATFEGVGYLIAFFILFGGIIAIIIAVLALCSTIAVGVITAISTVLITVLNFIFDFCHSAYASLYDLCAKAQQSTQPQEKPLSIWCYPLWLLLKVINFIVVKVLSFAFPISIGCSVILGIWAVWSVQSSVSRQFGISIFTYLGLFPFLDTLFTVLYFLVTVGAGVIILLSLGAEWNEWGNVLQLATGDYDAYVAQLRSQTNGMDSTSAQVIGQEGDKSLEQCNHYLSLLNDMLASAADLQEQADMALRMQNDSSVLYDMTEYIDTLSNVVIQLDAYPEGIPTNQFARLLIPQIEKAQKLNKTIVGDLLRIISRQTKQQNNAGTTMDFFAGCTTQEDLTRRHRALSKAFHPDVGGHEDTFKAMQNQYEERVKSTTP